MNWRIEVKPRAEKQYKKLDRPTRKRIKDTLKTLSECQNPFIYHRVKPLTGDMHGDYRLRVGGWRIFFTPDFQQRTLYVYAVLPRGDSY